MIIIGIDIDDTITETAEFLDEYKRIHPEECEVKELQNNKQVVLIKEEFIPKAFEQMAKEVELKPEVLRVLNEFKEKEYKIIIITARSDDYFISGAQMLTENYLLQKGITYDKLITHAGDKLEACLENKLDIMIDDRLEVHYALKDTNINSILFNTKHNLEKDVVIPRVSKWKEVPSLVSDIINKRKATKLLKKVI